jgi:hypothetical protein
LDGRAGRSPRTQALRLAIIADPYAPAAELAREFGVSAQAVSPSALSVTLKVARFSLVERDSKVAAFAIGRKQLTPPWKLDEATEADLIAAKNAAPAKTHDSDTLIKFVKAAKEAEAKAAESPIRVEITNASDFAEKDTVLRVERDQSGKLTGAVAHKV